jgi:Reverse transcriptase (RNA-dependent DNA polymerase)
MESGVRQGGVISCLLFNIYINELICRLEQSGYGCHMNGVYMGWILYGDDVMLLSGSIEITWYM